MKKILLHLASLALAVGILALLFQRQDWGNLLKRLSGARVSALGAAAAISVAYWLVKSARWRWTVAIEGQRIRLRRACISMLAGLGIGLLTPFRGGEVVRPMFIAPGARLRLAGWVVIERLFDLSAVLTLSVAGLVYVIAAGVPLSDGFVLSSRLLWVCPALIALALAPPLLLHYRPRRLWVLMARLLPKKARELAHVHLSWRQFGVFLATSLIGEMLSVLAVYFCLLAFGYVEHAGGVPNPDASGLGSPLAVALVPVVMLHNLLPATPGGFGVREGFAVLVFGLFGFAGEMVLAGYLTDAVIVLVIPGAVGIAGAWTAGVIREMRKSA